MKLARYSISGECGWGLVDDDASGITPLEGGIRDWGGAVCRGQGSDALRSRGEAIPLSSVRLLPPFERGGKILVAGANYRKHLADFGLSEPSAPHFFLKPHGALIGAGDPIAYPPLTSKLDFEVELVVVFGCSIEPGGDPYDAVLGYCVGNDVSARDLQVGTAGIGMDLLSAKGLDGTCPVGPWIVTRDSLPAGSPRLAMTMRVNGELRQNGNSGDMTWDVAGLARFIDQRTRIEAGDLMFTGTPEGVAQSDGRFLADGDELETAIEGIGALRNRVSRQASAVTG